MTDTPINPPTFPRAPLMERIKALIGDLARPFLLYVLGVATGYAIIIVAGKVQNGSDGAVFLLAVAALVGGAYGFKSWENAKSKAADVEIAKATQPVV